jgi:hypothetical protein
MVQFLVYTKEMMNDLIDRSFILPSKSLNMLGKLVAGKCIRFSEENADNVLPSVK